MEGEGEERRRWREEGIGERWGQREGKVEEEGQMGEEGRREGG